MVEISITLLKIVSAYLLFDSLYMVFSGALKGAGDTRFMMWSVALFSVIFLVLPCSIGIIVFDMGVHSRGSAYWFLLFPCVLWPAFDIIRVNGRICWL